MVKSDEWGFCYPFTEVQLCDYPLDTEVIESDDSFHYIPECITKFKKLKGIGLKKGRVKEINHLYKLKNLEFLRLMNSFIEDISVVYPLKNLNFLNLNGSLINVADMTSILMGLTKNLKKLQTLFISGDKRAKFVPSTTIVENKENDVGFPDTAWLIEGLSTWGKETWSDDTMVKEAKR